MADDELRDELWRDFDDAVLNEWLYTASPEYRAKVEEWLEKFRFWFGGEDKQ